MTKNYKVLTILVVIFILVVVGGAFITTGYFVRKKSSEKSLETELNFIQDTTVSAQSKPFLTKLPIKTGNYTIYYNSTNDRIEIVFAKGGRDIEILKAIFEKSIIDSLESIGVDTNKEKINWLIQQ